MQKIDYRQFIEDHTIDVDASGRGGGIKVDVSELFPYIENAVVGAWQNYLGGGLLGAVVGGAQFKPEDLHKRDLKKFYTLKEEIKKYFHGLTNHEGDEWEETTYIEDQRRPVSAY